MKKHDHKLDEDRLDQRLALSEYDAGYQKGVEDTLYRLRQIVITVKEAVA
jgi:hypothetical protein